MALASVAWMDAQSPPNRGLALEPVDFAAPAGDAARKESDESAPEAQPQRSLRIQTADEFLAQAAKEYEAGRVEPALWRLAADQGGNDESLVIAAYLRARATALQLQQKRGDASPGRKTGPMPAATTRKVLPEPPAESDWAEDAGEPTSGVKAKVKYLAAAAVALVVVGGVVWFVATPRGGESVPPAVAIAVPASEQAVPPESEQAVAAARTKQLRPAYEVEVRELKKAENWNVLVLYASDWTRKEPNNAAAWHELSGGYVKMRQLDDAFRAATNAAQLAPQDASLWSDLGHINLSLERLPEARVAFDRALSLRADDADALCGAALVAQRQGRPSDGDALAARVKSVEGGCRGVNSVAAVVR
jgi:tetratricopeptide (TPR) repeat protein